MDFEESYDDTSLTRNIMLPRIKEKTIKTEPDITKNSNDPPKKQTLIKFSQRKKLKPLLKGKSKDSDFVNNDVLDLMIKDGDDKSRNYKINPKTKHKYIKDLKKKTFKEKDYSNDNNPIDDITLEISIDEHKNIEEEKDNNLLKETNNTELFSLSQSINEDKSIVSVRDFKNALDNAGMPPQEEIEYQNESLIEDNTENNNINDNINNIDSNNQTIESNKNESLENTKTTIASPQSNPIDIDQLEDDNSHQTSSEESNLSESEESELAEESEEEEDLDEDDEFMEAEMDEEEKEAASESSEDEEEQEDNETKENEIKNKTKNKNKKLKIVEKEKSDESVEEDIVEEDIHYDQEEYYQVDFKQAEDDFNDLTEIKTEFTTDTNTQNRPYKSRFRTIDKDSSLKNPLTPVIENKNEKEELNDESNDFTKSESNNSTNNSTINSNTNKSTIKSTSKINKKKSLKIKKFKKATKSPKKYKNSEIEELNVRNDMSSMEKTINEDEDSFDPTDRERTTTAINRKVNNQVKGWADINETVNQDTIRSINFNKNPSEDLGGELGSLINDQDTFRKTTITFRANNSLLNENKFKNIEIERKIGEGGEGEVYRSFPLDNQLYAIKVFKIETFDENNMNNKIKTIIEEFNTFSVLDHNNLVKYLYLDIPEDSFDERVYIKLVMNYIKGVSLSSLVKKLSSINKTLSVEKVKSVGRDILKALGYLHSQDIVHRDLKPSNIMVSENFSAYLTDYGISKHIDEEISITHTTIGTPLYIAPEVFRKKCVKKTDVYSFGCTLLEMLTNKRPWHGLMFVCRLDELIKEDNTPYHYFKQYIKLPLDKDAEAVIEQCCRYDYEQRPSVEEILKMKFFE